MERQDALHYSKKLVQDIVNGKRQIMKMLE